MESGSEGAEPFGEERLDSLEKQKHVKHSILETWQISILHAESKSFEYTSKGHNTYLLYKKRTYLPMLLCRLIQRDILSFTAKAIYFWQVLITGCCITQHTFTKGIYRVSVPHIVIMLNYIFWKTKVVVNLVFPSARTAGTPTHIFVVYLMTLSVSHTMQRQMVGWLVYDREDLEWGGRDWEKQCTNTGSDWHKQCFGFKGQFIEPEYMTVLLLQKCANTTCSLICISIQLKICSVTIIRS